MSVKRSWQRPDGDRKKFEEEYDRIFGKREEKELSALLTECWTGGGAVDMYYDPIRDEVVEINPEALGDVNDTDK